MSNANNVICIPLPLLVDAAFRQFLLQTGNALWRYHGGEKIQPLQSLEAGQLPQTYVCNFCYSKI